MTPPESAPAPMRPRKRRYPATVRRVESLSPRMVRVTFTGDELAGFAWNGPAAHIKLVFTSEEAAAAQSGGQESRPTMRTYTPRRFDPRAAELDVDFVIHGDGPASTWAAQAAAGQTLQIAGPGRSYAVEAADWYLLAGDDTAIPAISTILEALPAGARALVYLEVTDAAEERSITDRANTAVVWLRRGPDPARAGRELETALRDLDLPPGSGRVYVACEAGAMRRIRRHLLQERMLERSRVVTRGYWKLGEVDHPDRDYGEDADT